jgi:hypothetical protein
LPAKLAQFHGLVGRAVKTEVWRRCAHRQSGRTMIWRGGFCHIECCVCSRGGRSNGCAVEFRSWFICAGVIHDFSFGLKPMVESVPMMAPIRLPKLVGANLNCRAQVRTVGQFTLGIGFLLPCGLHRNARFCAGGWRFDCCAASGPDALLLPCCGVHRLSFH